VTAPARSRRRSRVVLWVSIGVAGALAVLVAVLATSGPASQVVAQSPLVGKPAPAIAGPSLAGGRAVSLASLHGRWVLVNFSASWCVPCRDEMPQLRTFARAHARAGNAVILTVAYDQSDIAGLRSMLRSSQAGWPAVNDGQADVTYGVGGLPESYLVDPNGTVVAKYVGGVVASQLDSEISRLSFGSAGSAASAGSFGSAGSAGSS
jgi:cytochrome c biogenesis protein CcmG/thiol:disulfide interchange protein DsbE